MDVLYLDMSKAFDKVSHAKLLHRLRQFGFGGNILRWFRLYLTNRHQHTTILGTTSKSLPVNIRCTPRVHSWSITVLAL